MDAPPPLDIDYTKHAMNKIMTFKQQQNSAGKDVYEKNRTGRYWTPDEEIKLRTELALNMSIMEIANLHDRTVGGVMSRIKRLGLSDKTIIYCHDPNPVKKLKDGDQKIIDEIEIFRRDLYNIVENIEKMRKLLDLLEKAQYI